MEFGEENKEVEYKASLGENGNVILKKKSKIKSGSKSRSGGSQFELRVRKDLEAKGWIVDKWSNNLDLDENKIHPAKRRFARFNKNMGVMTIGTGFPDFIAFQLMEKGRYKIIGVEVKMNGILSKIEKEKCCWYLRNNIFSEILIAKKIKEKNRVRVEYKNFLKVSESGK